MGLKPMAALIADSTETGDVVDIYEAAGIPKPELSELNPEFAARAQQATNPQLAIEALPRRSWRRSAGYPQQSRPGTGVL